MAAALQPGAVRVGGGDEDKMVYGVDDSYECFNCTDDYDPWTVRNQSEKNLLLVTPDRYDALYHFSDAAGLRLIWAFNIFYGVCCDAAYGGQCGSVPWNCSCSTPGNCHGCRGGGPCKSWDPSNAESMLQYMKTSKQVPWAVQLGNEGGNGIAPLSGAAAAAAFLALDDAIERVWGGPPSGGAPKPRIMGPDGGVRTDYHLALSFLCYPEDAVVGIVRHRVDSPTC